MPCHEVTKMEIEILRECAGELPASPWGAAVGACLEQLEDFNLVKRGIITQEGRDFLKDWHDVNDK
jgi:hypothetical protein